MGLLLQLEPKIDAQRITYRKRNNALRWRSGGSEIKSNTESLNFLAVFSF